MMYQIFFNFRKRDLTGFCLVLFFACFLTCSSDPPLDPTAEVEQEFVVLVGLDSDPQSVPPGGSSIITALVLNQNNRPVAGDTIAFSTSAGTVQPTVVTTNDSGQATVIFTAPEHNADAEITGMHRGNEQSVIVEVRDTTPRSVSIEPEQYTMLADGISSGIITSTWWTEDGDPLSGIRVSFEANIGTIEATAVTDSAGRARVEYVSAASRTDVIAQITIRARDLEGRLQLLLRGISFQLLAAPKSIIADGRSESSVTVLLKELTTSVAIPGATVTFGADLGTIPNSILTNERGVAATTLISAVETGVSTVTASYGETLSDTVTVSFTQSVPSNLSVSARPPEILADNKSTSVITAIVSDQTNNPVPDGTPVNFEIVSGTGSLESSKRTEGGTASSVLTSSTQPGTVTIAVNVAGLSDTTSVRYIIGEAATVTLVADSTTLPADGKTSTTVSAYVYDAAGNPVQNGTKVDFTASIGDVTPSSQTVGGVARAKYSSSQTGTAVITAFVNELEKSTTIQLRPGAPNSILLTIDPTNLGVKDSGRNQTVTITAVVIDSKNNTVSDGTSVVFSIFQSPGGGEFLSTVAPLPTLNGRVQVSLNSGVRSGTVRIMAEVTDSLGVPISPEVRAITTEITIFAGPPFIENVNDQATSHLSVGASQQNILGWGFVDNRTTITAVVGDKFNNPVPAGTAVYFTTTGGVISTHTGYTDEEGVAQVILHSAQPLPNITRYYNTFVDPNEDHPDFTLPTSMIPGPIPDFERSQIINSVGGLDENDGIARVLAVTEGVDSNGNAARAWAVANVVFSGLVTSPSATFTIATDRLVILPGEAVTIDFEIFDENGNPVVPGSEITTSASAGSLSWSSLLTSDPGQTAFQVLLTNNLDPTDPDARPTATAVTITVKGDNGNLVGSTPSISLNLF